ncbi:MAG: hypothetical protein HUJ99_08385 [Bacteroidaceae bacterium]|nr:hypothetical protein [Bacteroidaceae bacterium]
MINKVICSCLLMITFTAQAQELVGKQWDYHTNDECFTQPYVDVDEWRDTPVRHRYVHGGFKSNNTRFSFYFPEQKDYEGRFYQYITPMPDSELIVMNQPADEYNSISFSIHSGAYFIETNEGGAIDLSNPMSADPTIGAYRANAACASFSRLVAQEIYGSHRPYGYCFGGSGGGYRTVGSMENTQGVWDGAVPYVLGSPYAIPNVFASRMNAMRILDQKLPQIVDAMEPGGSGDPYAGLNDEEATALREVTKMGFPLKGWYGYKDLGIHGFLVLYPSVVMMDKSYFEEDFWNKPGYYGHDHPDSFRHARIQEVATISRFFTLEEGVEQGLCSPLDESSRGTADKSWVAAGGQTGEKPAGIVLDKVMPGVQFLGGDLVMLSGEAQGKSFQLAALKGNRVAFAPTVNLADLAKVKPGDQVRVDNSHFLAVQTYYRHQMPDTEAAGWEQFKTDDGKPMYPQRPMLLGPIFTRGAAGCVPTGNIHGKIILCCSLMDREAYAWQGDWYRQQVKKHLGNWTDDNMRIWYTEHALHGDHHEELDDPMHAVPYNGVLQQALRDVALWVEKGIEPPQSTAYQIQDAQVVVPATANERKGIQPVVRLTITGDDKQGVLSHEGKRIDTRKGAAVDFSAHVEIPEGTGQLVSVEWSFDGKTYTRGELNASYAFPKKPGTYFVTCRVASQREGETALRHATVYNLDRVRVVVK